MQQSSMSCYTFFFMFKLLFEKILNQDNFINSSSFPSFVHFLVKYLDDHKLTVSMEFISY